MSLTRKLRLGPLLLSRHFSCLINRVRSIFQSTWLPWMLKTKMTPRCETKTWMPFGRRSRLWVELFWGKREGFTSSFWTTRRAKCGAVSTESSACRNGATEPS